MNSKKGIIDRYLYFKLSLDSIYGHLGFWATLAEKAMVFGIFIKVFNITNYYLIGVIGFLGICFMFWFGHTLLKKGIIERQTSLANSYNKEVVDILKIVKKIANEQ